MTSKNISTNTLTEIAALIEDSKHAEALEMHLWFHEESRKLPGMGGVRLSFALDLWLKLANQYPPAMVSLKQLKNSYKEVLLNGNGTFENFHDLYAINQYLDNSEDSYSVFMHVHEQYPQQAKDYYHVVEDILVEMRKYDICAAYITNPMKKYEHFKKMHKLNKKISKQQFNSQDMEFEKYTEHAYTTGVCQLIEIMSALGKHDIAKDIQSAALSYLDHAEIRKAI